MEEFAIFQVVVVHQALSNQGVSFLRCFHINKKQPLQFPVLQCPFLPSYPQKLHFTFELRILSLQFCQHFFLVSHFNSVSSNAVCYHREASSFYFCSSSDDLCPTLLLFHQVFCLMTVSNNGNVPTLQFARSYNLTGFAGARSID